MNFSERSAQRKKARDLKNEMKQLKKDMLNAGMEKNRVNLFCKELQETLEQKAVLQTAYEDSKVHIHASIEKIDSLFLRLEEGSPSLIREGLAALNADLGLVYHDCSIRMDDLDFQSTYQCMKRMETQYGEAGSGISAIMLRSELENLRAVLADAKGYQTPDFFSLSYYVLHEERTSLKDMENDQRNEYVKKYCKEKFQDEILSLAAGSEIETRLKEYFS